MKLILNEDVTKVNRNDGNGVQSGIAGKVQNNNRQQNYATANNPQGKAPESTTGVNNNASASNNNNNQNQQSPSDWKATAKKLDAAQLAAGIKIGNMIVGPYADLTGSGVPRYVGNMYPVDDKGNLIQKAGSARIAGWKPGLIDISKGRGAYVPASSPPYDTLPFSYGGYVYHDPWEYFNAFHFDEEWRRISPLSTVEKSKIREASVEKVYFSDNKYTYWEIPFDALSSDSRIVYAATVERQSAETEAKNVLAKGVHDVEETADNTSISKEGRIDVIIERFNELTDMNYDFALNFGLNDSSNQFRAADYTPETNISTYESRTESLLIKCISKILNEGGSSLDIGSAGKQHLDAFKDNIELQPKQAEPGIRYSKNNQQTQKKDTKVSGIINKLSNIARGRVDYRDIKPDYNKTYKGIKKYNAPGAEDRIIKIETTGKDENGKDNERKIGNYIYNSLTSNMPGSGDESSTLMAKYDYFMGWATAFGFDNINNSNSFISVVKALCRRGIKPSTAEFIQLDNLSFLKMYNLYASDFINDYNVQQICRGIILELGEVDKNGKNKFEGTLRRFIDLDFNKEAGLLLKSFKGYNIYSQRKFLRNFIAYFRKQDPATKEEMAKLILSTAPPEVKNSTYNYLSKIKDGDVANAGEVYDKATYGGTDIYQGGNLDDFD